MIKFKPKSEFSRNVLTLMTGTTITQAIPIAISPILTRIYTPEDFGIFALYMSVVSIVSVVATGCYELAIMLPKKDEVWCQILADVTGCMIKVPKVKEATALGAAMAVGVAAGMYKSMVNASESLVEWYKEYIPNAENFDTYNKIKVQWQVVYANQLTLVDKGLTESMWKAPGV